MATGEPGLPPGGAHAECEDDLVEPVARERVYRCPTDQYRAGDSLQACCKIEVRQIAVAREDDEVGGRFLESLDDCPHEPPSVPASVLLRVGRHAAQSADEQGHAVMVNRLREHIEYGDNATRLDQHGDTGCQPRVMTIEVSPNQPTKVGRLIDERLRWVPNDIVHTPIMGDLARNPVGRRSRSRCRVAPVPCGNATHSVRRCARVVRHGTAPIDAAARRRCYGRNQLLGAT